MSMWSPGSMPGHGSVRTTGRKEERIKRTVNARLYGTDTNGKPFDVLVQTADISAGGALLVNVPVALRVGDVFGIRHGDVRARYRVQWLTNAGGTSHPQMGVQCLDVIKNIFGAEVRQTAPAVEFRAITKRRPGELEEKVQADKRTSFRHVCDLGVQLRTEDSKVGLWARCTDVSEGGCYVTTRSPMTVGTRFTITIFLQPQTIEVPAIVRTVFPAMGMGVQFQFASADQQGRIKSLIASMFQQPGAAAPEAMPALEQQSAEESGGEINELFKFVSGLRDWAVTASLPEEQQLELDRIARSVRHQLIALRKRIDAGEV